MDSLLKMMNGVYLPTFLANESWPESVKKEFSGQLHKFMASLTETANQVKGHTVLYLPSEDLTELVDMDWSEADGKGMRKGALDKDLVQRLESTLIHWTRQIKEVVSNQETSHHVDNSGPLEEIEFWRSRTIDLSGIRRQLDRPGVRNIVEVLKLAQSSYLKPFETLSDMIQQGSIEAQNNLKFLSTLQGPCTKLAAASPEEIPAILPDILNLIRMIWTISKFYNTDERITGLLRKVSNQIIVQCSKKIQLTEIFEGDVLKSMVHLQQSIKCGEAWHDIYDKTAKAIDSDPTVEVERERVRKGLKNHDLPLRRKAGSGTSIRHSTAYLLRSTPLFSAATTLWRFARASFNSRARQRSCLRGKRQSFRLSEDREALRSKSRSMKLKKRSRNTSAA